MKIVRSTDLNFVPASHEDPKNPGVLKKVLFAREDIISGRPQMINWASLPAGKSFASHYHEDMDEIFILVSRVVRMKVQTEVFELQKGDAVVVEMGEVHTMKNPTEFDVEYIVVGITRDQGGKTINVPQEDL
jgi:mannose-6-phosphate isomerase-like protein (cupin superfamily)